MEDPMVKVTRRRPVAPKAKKKTTTRVTIDFPIAEHRKLKAIAAIKGVTLQEYIRAQVIPEAEVSYVSDEKFLSLVDQLIEENKDALKRLADK
jgi:hypothetical protein